MSKQEKTSKLKLEGNYIDKILKENCANLLPFIFGKMLGLKFSKITNLPAIRQQVTLEKEPDFLRLIYNDEYPEGAIVQLEFETSDDREMLGRMLLYLGMEYKRSKKPILQYVLYLGKGKSGMQSKLNFGQVNYGFTILNIEDFSYSAFIKSTVPEEVILALLSDYENRTLDEILELIIGRIKELRGDSLATKRFINQLIMFSRFRNLQNQTIKKVKEMGFTTFDYQTDLLYLEGIEKGEEIGVQKGIEKGAQKNAIYGITKMTGTKIANSLIAEYLGVKLSFVKSIQKDLLQKDEIIQLLKKGEPIETIAKKLKVNALLVEVLSDELEANKKN